MPNMQNNNNENVLVTAPRVFARAARAGAARVELRDREALVHVEARLGPVRLRVRQEAAAAGALKAAVRRDARGLAVAARGARGRARAALHARAIAARAVARGRAVPRLEARADRAQHVGHREAPAILRAVDAQRREDEDLAAAAGAAARLRGELLLEHRVRRVLADVADAAAQLLHARPRLGADELAEDLLRARLPVLLGVHRARARKARRVLPPGRGARRRSRGREAEDAQLAEVLGDDLGARVALAERAVGVGRAVAPAPHALGRALGRVAVRGRAAAGAVGRGAGGR
jgi:hypothetical protein